ncbi:MAG: hypothetical protein ACFE0J_22380 [Elainellaceae cyanobacterium]
MKKSLLIFVVFINSIAIGMSVYLSTLENPTDIQKELSTTTNTIAIAGTTTLIGLLDDDQNKPNAT